MSNTSKTPVTDSTGQHGRTYRGPFVIMTVLFFMWGFMTVFNDILIPHFKEAFTLDYFHAMLVQFAFFGAYFVGSLLYFLISWKFGDPIAKIGYKNGVVMGLLLAAAGSALFWPAATLAPRTTLVSPGDLRNIASLAAKLNKPTDPVSVFMAGQLSDQTRQLLEQGTSVNQEELTKSLAQDLNKIVDSPAIYDEQRFAGVTLPPTTKELLDKKPEGPALVRLNRVLLDNAYPGQITRNLAPYWLFLVSLFIVGCGFAMLQIAANPYVTILGPEKTASSRLNLAQGFNSIGTTIGPIIGAYLIFHYFAKAGASGAESVKVPYLVFCFIFLALAAVFFLIRLPHIGEGKVVAGAGALKYPHVVLGVIAIFMYVGGEVSVGSAIINFLNQPTVAGLSALDASKYVSIYWGGLMIGRFMGAVELSEMKRINKQIFLMVIPLMAYMLLWVAISAPLDAMRSGSHAQVFTLWRNQFTENWTVFRSYLAFVGLCWLLFQFGKSQAGRTLAVFSGTVFCLLLTAILVGGKVAMWCVVSVGLFTSIGWSNTFSLALEGTGIFKSQVSSLLVMAILGGAVLPPLQGKIADLTQNLQISFIVPLIAYAYVCFYGLKGHAIGRERLPAQEATQP